MSDHVTALCQACYYQLRQLRSVATDATNLAPVTPTFSLFRAQTLDLATGVSWLQVRDFGTLYTPHCGSMTLNSGILIDS